MERISFDRAADYYDRTRGLPDETRDRIADLLTAELSERRPCLEIGVGTGRMALPLHDRGVSLLGADIAAAMLERLVESAGGQQPFPLFLADAMRLPLADSSVDAVLAAHVLHLLPRWQDAVDEVLRVLRPGGVFLVDFGNLRLDAAAPWNAECRQVLGRLGVVQVRPGVSEPEPVVQHLAGRAVLRPLTPVTMTVQRTLGQDVTAWEQQLYSWTWPFPADTMRQAAAEVRAWAEATGWPIDREVPIDYVIRWWAFDLV